jgi:hypothetical protein
VAFSKRWLPTLDTLRNFLLLPPTEILTVFQTLREVILSKINDSNLSPTVSRRSWFKSLSA